MSAKRLDGKVALITGAGRGIGRAVALAYAAAGARLVLLSRTARELKETESAARRLGAETFARSLDVRRWPPTRAFVAAALKRWRAIDVLVNNAGVLGPHGPFIELGDRAWDEALAVNVTAPFRLTRETLRRSMLPRRRGCVINVSSSIGRRGRAGWGPYAVTKFGLEGMTQVWADECKDLGIRFYTVNPGATRTRMRAEAYPGEDPASIKGPEAVAEAFVELAADDCAVPTGTAVELDRASGRILNG